MLGRLFFCLLMVFFLIVHIAERVSLISIWNCLECSISLLYGIKLLLYCKKFSFYWESYCNCAGIWLTCFWGWMGCHCQNQDSVITVVWFFFHFLSTLNVSSREFEKLGHSSFHLCAFWNSSVSVWSCYYYLGIGVGRGWGMGVTYIYLKDLTFSCFTVTSTAQLQISYDGWHPYHIHTPTNPKKNMDTDTSNGSCILYIYWSHKRKHGLVFHACYE